MKKLFIKNMVCPRCIISVQQIFSDQKIDVKDVVLGEVELVKELSNKQKEKLSQALISVGFELLDNQKNQLIEKIKSLLIQKVQTGNIEDHFSIQKFLSEHIFKEYSSISKLFSEVESITIEQFFILQKIEKVKEWLIYNQLSLAEISYLLGYSSPQHLSAQFKKVTGMTPGYFKKLGPRHRKPIDEIK